MFPEKEIVKLWLNSRGYLVVGDINAGKNKVIDALALKIEQGKLSEVVHVEVSVSVSGPGDVTSDVKSKFSDPLVEKAIQKFTQRFSGEKEVKRLLVSNTPAVSAVDGIEIKPFENVLVEVLSGIDRQNYSDPTVRALQLFKYLLLANPDALSQILVKLQHNKTISSQNMERLVQSLLSLPETKRVFAKAQPFTESFFASSPITRPEPLAKFVLNSLSTRSFNLFLKELFKNEKAQKFTKKSSPKQKSLMVFLD